MDSLVNLVDRCEFGYREEAAEFEISQSDMLRFIVDQDYTLGEAHQNVLEFLVSVLHILDLHDHLFMSALLSICSVYQRNDRQQYYHHGDYVEVI